VAEISAKAVKELRDQTGAGMMDCKRVLADADGDLKRAVELLRERGLAKAGKREGRATSEGVISVALNGSSGGMIDLGCETDFVARTDDFIALADSLAVAVLADAGIDSPDALLDAEVGGEKVREKVAAAIAKMGENVVLKRVSRVEVDGGGLAGGYVHAGGKLGVLVGLRTGASGDAAEGIARDLAMHVAAADPTPISVDRDGVDAELLASERTIFRNQAEQSGKPEKVIDRIVEGRINKYLAEICLVEQAFVKDPDRTVGDLVKALGEGTQVTGFERFKLGEASEE
jgi:elongation factor Ts